MSKASRTIEPEDDLRVYELIVDERDAKAGTFQYKFHGRIVAEATEAALGDITVIGKVQLYARHSPPESGGEFIDFVGYSSAMVRNAEGACFRRVCNGDDFATVFHGMVRFDAAEAFFRFQFAGPSEREDNQPGSICRSLRDRIWLLDAVEKVRRRYQDALTWLVVQCHDDLLAAVPSKDKHRHVDA
jgi:hypothetical protein